MRALLFDLDGTLTKSGGAGSRALGKALHARPNARAELRRMRLDGMTDRAIARIVLAAEGDPSRPIEDRMRDIAEGDIDAVIARYLEALAVECAQGVYEALPGVADLIGRLAQRSDALLGLCTGNHARGAELKLTSAKLWGPFRFGGYGSDAEVRTEIVRIAWGRARQLGATNALVIGDTPRDILAAHEAGLPACGVATGRYSPRELAENGAEIVVSGFTDVEASERLLLGA